MEWLSKVFGYYILAFKKCFDYKSPAIRSELNYFILVFSVIYLFLLFIGFGYIIASIMQNPEYISNHFNIFMVFAYIFCLINLLPSLSIIYRRMLDIFADRAKLFYSGYIVLWLIQILCSVFVFIKMNSFAISNQTPPIELIMYSVILSLVGQISGLIMLAAIIFLMCKKGNS